jgi:glycosyltransferase involved in cell wall biosynthesis
MPIPDLFLAPSYWKLQEMKDRFGKDRVLYLPPPIDPKEFEEVREINLSRDPNDKKRFLHVVGTLATHDRNGTLAILGALKYTKSDFELVVRSQRVLPEKYLIKDDRLTYEVGNLEKNSDLYRDFDAMILPRRYGGLALSMNEALMSGLPVMMSDISPNNKALPKEWLFPAEKYTEFMATTMIDVYLSDRKAIAKKIDQWVKKLPSKLEALSIAEKSYSMDILRSEYDSLLQE